MAITIPYSLLTSRVPKVIGLDLVQLIVVTLFFCHTQWAGIQCVYCNSKHTKVSIYRNVWPKIETPKNVKKSREWLDTTSLPVSLYLLLRALFFGNGIKTKQYR